MDGKPEGGRVPVDIFDASIDEAIDRALGVGAGGLGELPPEEKIRMPVAGMRGVPPKDPPVDAKQSVPVKNGPIGGGFRPKNSEFDLKIAKQGENREKKEPIVAMIEAIDAEFAADTTITVGNLSEKSKMESAIKGKWASKLMAEKIRGNRLRSMLMELRDGLDREASNARARGGFLGSRRSADAAAAGNPEIRNLQRAIQDNQLVVEHLDRLWEAVQGFGYTLKNSIDVTKLEMGI